MTTMGTAQPLPAKPAQRIVKEWRITSRVFGFKVQYWIESDPKKGGVPLVETWKTVGAVESEAKKRLREQTNDVDAGTLAEMLLIAFPAVNRVDVCDANGTGAALRRIRE